MHAVSVKKGGRVGGARDDRRKALAFLLGAGRAKQDAARLRRRLRTPPSRNGAPAQCRHGDAARGLCETEAERRTDAFWLPGLRRVKKGNAPRVLGVPYVAAPGMPGRRVVDNGCARARLDSVRATASTPRPAGRQNPLDSGVPHYNYRVSSLSLSRRGDTAVIGPMRAGDQPLAVLRRPVRQTDRGVVSRARKGPVAWPVP
jgi:hypothetical protein